MRLEDTIACWKIQKFVNYPWKDFELFHLQPFPAVFLGVVHYVIKIHVALESRMQTSRPSPVLAGPSKVFL